MKKIFWVLFFAGISVAQYPVTPFTYYWTPAAGDTVTFQKWKANNDSVLSGVTRTITELNTNVVHFNNNVMNHDSTVKYMKVDTIRSNPDVDSIKGKPFIDTIETRIIISDSSRCAQSRVDTLTSDSIYTRALTVTGDINEVDSITTDNLVVLGRAKLNLAEIDIINSDPTIDSATVTTGIKANHLTIDTGYAETFMIGTRLWAPFIAGYPVFDSLYVSKATVVLLLGDSLYSRAGYINQNLETGSFNTGTANIEILRVDNKKMAYDTGSFPVSLQSLAGTTYSPSPNNDSVGMAYWSRVCDQINIQLTSINVYASNASNIYFNVLGIPDSLHPWSGGGSASTFYVTTSFPSMDTSTMYIEFDAQNKETTIRSNGKTAYFINPVFSYIKGRDW